MPAMIAGGAPGVAAAPPCGASLGRAVRPDGCASGALQAPVRSILSR